MPEHSKACCTIPPVIAKDYKPKGQWITIDGLKTCMKCLHLPSPIRKAKNRRRNESSISLNIIISDVTGSPESKRAILWCYDIFGFFPQTIQGADILASSSYLVIIPDFFEGSAADPSWYPPTTEEHRKNLGIFITGPAEREKTLHRIPTVVKEAWEKYPNIQKWGAIGFCWGGKVVAVSSQKDTLFKASAQSSPAFIDTADAGKITIPHIVLASRDEDTAEIKSYNEKLTAPKVVKTYDQRHGFQSAR